ncbi:sensor histidine kinase [Paenibacillus allorhizosphaerae]|uniref:histidine kinase n=1 Tax=Paenibacillus allorhizosphaerae TaxID=2849866 RepID=A0ABN7TTZ0_9BACL|nr:HAMP domain-containing sensor histidine kinase [Paenibacillus allorhizosphaerae]CAG7655775.1 hypothetical protein PAECIP111802_06203 [Paenibacillus allorhizosphaerae]
MKNWPVAVKIWGVFASITLSIFIMLALFLPWTLKGFFTDQIYDLLMDSQASVRFEAQNTAGFSVSAKEATSVSATVDFAKPVMILPIAPVEKTKDSMEPQDAAAQKEVSSVKELRIGKQDARVDPLEMRIKSNEIMLDRQTISMSKIEAQPARPFAVGIAGSLQPPEAPVVQHMLIMGSAEISRSEAALPQTYVEAIEQDAHLQQSEVQKYSRNIDNKTIFYVIRKEELSGKPGYVVSYSWGNYRNDLVYTMFGRLMLLMVALILCSWLPCLALAKYLTRPLVQMERHVGRMSERDWHEPLATTRSDEIGRLARAIETMRLRLVRQDKAQQFFLQNISHELKTPVMVIRSYAQSIMDGLFPKGSLKESVEVIMKESDRLEKRVRDLLYLNKLNYVSSREKSLQPFDLKTVIEDVVERLRYRRTDIEWAVEADSDTMVCGDREQWGVALENLLDNQLRYAKGRITIEVQHPAESAGADAGQPAQPTVRIWNDGPMLDEAAAAELFEPFRTGTNGQFGLGLTIVRQIAEYHRMTARAVNERGGAAFYLEPSN